MTRALLCVALCGCFDLASITPFPCAEDSSCPTGYVCGTGVGCVQQNICSVDQQDCDGSRCTIVVDTTGNLDTTCLTSEGARQGAEWCTREAAGLDDCAAGAYCNGALSPNGDFVCRTLCTAKQDCVSSDQTCVKLVADAGHVSGFCAETCALGEATCGSASTCRDNNGIDGGVITTCFPDGPKAEWDKCAGADCGHGLGCFGFCFKECGGNASCEAGETCVAGLPNGVGACECNFFAACPSGTSCRPLIGQTSSFGYCNINGTGHSGDQCTTDDDCGANLSCASFTGGAPFFCRQLCDVTHACSSGACEVQNGIANSGGICH